MKNPKRDFSEHLFWDLSEKTLDYNRHKKFIIKRVLELGTIEDWNKIKELFGIDEIANEVASIKDIDIKSATFISVISDIPIKKFRCFSTKRSVPKHWIY